jgi:hypothetical protein
LYEIRTMKSVEIILSRGEGNEEDGRDESNEGIL